MSVVEGNTEAHESLLTMIHLKNLHSDDHNVEDQVSSSEWDAMTRICCGNLDEVNDREAQEEEEGGSRRTKRQTVKIYVRE